MDYSLFAKYFESQPQKILNLVPVVLPWYYRVIFALDQSVKKWWKDESLLTSEPYTFNNLSNKAPPGLKLAIQIN